MTSTGAATVRSLAVLSAFTLMLAATSAPPPDKGKTSPASPSAGTPTEAATAPAAAAPTVPDSSSWPEVQVPEAKLAMRLPPDIQVDKASSGFDAEWMGRHVGFKNASGLTWQFCDNCSMPATSIAKTREDYKGDGSVTATLVDADDAVLVTRNEDPVGDYCEATACEDVGGKTICAGNVGAIIDMDNKVTKATTQECWEVIAIARSLRALP